MKLILYLTETELTREDTTSYILLLNMTKNNVFLKYKVWNS